MEINLIIASVSGAIALALLAGGYVRRASRGAYWLGAIAFGCASLSGYYDAFWPLVCFAVIGGWAFIAGSRVLDTNWRMRTTGDLSRMDSFSANVSGVSTVRSIDSRMTR